MLLRALSTLSQRNYIKDKQALKRSTSSKVEGWKNMYMLNINLPQPEMLTPPSEEFYVQNKHFEASST